MEAVNSCEMLAKFCRGNYSSLSFCGYYDLLYFILPKFQVERRCVLWLLHSHKKLKYFTNYVHITIKLQHLQTQPTEKIKKNLNADKPYEESNFKLL